LGFEYRPIPYIGFGVGIGGGNSTLTPKSDPIADLLLPILLFGGSSSNSSSSLLPLLLFSGSFNSPAVSIGYNLLAFDFTFHANKDRFFDPFIGVGITGGLCTGAAACNVAGGEGKAGVQLNFSSAFIYLQGQYQSLTFTGTGDASGAAANLTNSLGTLGAGFRF
jgi:hypothetical protein